MRNEVLALSMYTVGKNAGYGREELDGLTSQLRSTGVTAGKAMLNIEETRLQADGMESILLTSRVPLRDDQGKVIGILGFYADITDRKMLEGQLVQAQKLESIGQLAAGIAHEINTPIQFIGDNVNFLRDAFTELDELYKRYTQILPAAKDGAIISEIITEIEEVAAETDVEYLEEEIPKSIDQSLEGVARVAKIVQAMKEFSHPGQDQKIPVNINKSLESTVTIIYEN